MRELEAEQELLRHSQDAAPWEELSLDASFDDDFSLAAWLGEPDDDWQSAMIEGSVAESESSRQRQADESAAKETELER